MAEPATEVAPARLRDLLAYLRPHRMILVFALTISVAGAGLSLLQPVMINRMIAAVAAGQTVSAPLITLVVLALAASALGAVQQYLLERTAEGMVCRARHRLIHRLLRLPVSEYDARRTGDLVSRVGSDTTLLRSVLTGGLVDALGGLLVAVGSVVAMALIDLVLLGITVTVIGLATVVVVVASGRIQSLTQQSQASVGRVAAGTERALSGIRTIRAAVATDREEARLQDEISHAYRLGVRIARLGAVLWPVSGLAIQGAFLAVLGVGGYRVAVGTLSVADLITFVLFLFMMLMPLGAAFSAVLSVRNALGALARISDVLDLPTEGSNDQLTPGDLEPGDLEPGPLEPGLLLLGDLKPGDLDDLEPGDTAGGVSLSFENVCFGYAEGRPVLREVSFTVPVGSTTAIVGPSGAGKSTLLALVERFYDADTGVIRLGGRDLRSLPRETLRSRIGYVEQDAPVLAGTIRENLLLGQPEADDARLRAALASVNLQTRIDEHPEGLEAVVGDAGVGLSGGERQRLAIARALLRESPLLLLDEPTASLDGRNEQAMRAAIRQVATGRTVVIVAHRLATVADADQIVVLDQGRVLAVGRHLQLLAGNDLYRELASHQLLI